MKQNLEKYLVTLFIVVFSTAFAGSAIAHDKNDNRDGARISLTFLVDGVSDVYQVTAPVNPPLRYIKRHFMAKSSLPVKHADHYVIEKVVTTTLPTRDPNIILPPGVRMPPASAPITEYVLLDDSMSLGDLGIVAGDTLRIREMDNHDLSASHHGHHKHHSHDRHHRR